MFIDIVASSLGSMATLPGKPPAGFPTEPYWLCLDVNDDLYREGDLRTHVYRLEQGAIAVYEKCVGRPNHTLKLVGRGGFVGLGCFERYRDSALAMANTLLSCLDEQEFITLAERDPSLRKQQVDAIHRDFERRKAAIRNRYPSTPAEAVAAFLVSVSRQNVHEGRSATIVSDSLKCGVVANLLGIEIETLEKALFELKNKGLIREAASCRVHLLDLERLECLADGAVTLSQI